MEFSEIFKALSDPNRVKIVNMLSEKDELCACRILEKFEMTQPTLSHHMKILCTCSLVNSRKEGKWSYYSLDDQVISEIKEFFSCLQKK